MRRRLVSSARAISLLLGDVHQLVDKIHEHCSKIPVVKVDLTPLPILLVLIARSTPQAERIFGARESV